jgi:hypothetical protein
MDELSLISSSLCWNLQFQDGISRIKNDLEGIASAVKQTRDSPLLRRVLGQVLAIGNILNGNTARGQANGFTADILGKLSTTKDATNANSLLDFVFATMTRAKPSDASALLEELSMVPRASKLALADVDGDVQSTLGELRSTFLASLAFHSHSFIP